MLKTFQPYQHHKRSLFINFSTEFSTILHGVFPTFNQVFNIYTLYNSVECEIPIFSYLKTTLSGGKKDKNNSMKTIQTIERISGTLSHSIFLLPP